MIFNQKMSGRSSFMQRGRGRGRGRDHRAETSERVPTRKYGAYKHSVYCDKYYTIGDAPNVYWHKPQDYDSEPNNYVYTMLEFVNGLNPFVENNIDLLVATGDCSEPIYNQVFALAHAAISDKKTIAELETRYPGATVFGTSIKSSINTRKHHYEQDNLLKAGQRFPDVDINVVKRVARLESSFNKGMNSLRFPVERLANTFDYLSTTMNELTSLANDANIDQSKLKIDTEFYRELQTLVPPLIALFEKQSAARSTEARQSTESDAADDADDAHDADVNAQ